MVRFLSSFIGVLGLLERLKKTIKCVFKFYVMYNVKRECVLRDHIQNPSGTTAMERPC